MRTSGLKIDDAERELWRQACRLHRRSLSQPTRLPLQSPRGKERT
jgi:hypothetical protein